MDPETPCKIDACFHDWRTVKGRKMLQLIFEVPLEQQGEILTLLGPPDSVGSKWCMIALRADNAVEEVRQAPVSLTNATQSSGNPTGRAAPSQASEASGPTKDEGAYLVQQCAIACNDARFQMYLRQSGYSVDDAEEAAIVIRERLGINSRAQLATNKTAANGWKLFHATYDRWLTDQKWKGSVNG